MAWQEPKLGRKRKKPEKILTFYVTNIPGGISNYQLREAFFSFGKIRDAFSPKKKDCYGGVFAFVRFADVDTSIGISPEKKTREDVRMVDNDKGRSSSCMGNHAGKVRGNFDGVMSVDAPQLHALNSNQDDGPRVEDCLGGQAHVSNNMVGPNLILNRHGDSDDTCGSTAKVFKKQ
ncbi:hypothetical protein QVD17_30584 [Tagetes erecta]|uniref:RRM domain-containing protein n=1 Tax=Tagetes erecta TaxID=13708 RepID=A0AAD8NG44_TARER|nr:hypothetical protein QVD17_30584 [Tagetes erecta]